MPMGGYAEQAFLNWYFRWDRWVLPSIYNLHFRTYADNNYTTACGRAPIVIHFNGWIGREPLIPGPADDEWPFLCHAPKQSDQPHTRHKHTSPIVI